MELTYWLGKTFLFLNNKGAFKMEISFRAMYPFKPPKITSTINIYHLNILMKRVSSAFQWLVLRTESRLSEVNPSRSLSTCSGLSQLKDALSAIKTSDIEELDSYWESDLWSKICCCWFQQVWAKTPRTLFRHPQSRTLEIWHVPLLVIHF